MIMVSYVEGNHTTTRKLKTHEQEDDRQIYDEKERKGKQSYLKQRKKTWGQTEIGE